MVAPPGDWWRDHPQDFAAPPLSPPWQPPSSVAPPLASVSPLPSSAPSPAPYPPSLSSSSPPSPLAPAPGQSPEKLDQSECFIMNFWPITGLYLIRLLTCSNWTSMGASIPSLAPFLATSSRVRITCFSFFWLTRSSVSNMTTSITSSRRQNLMKLNTLSRANQVPGVTFSRIGRSVSGTRKLGAFRRYSPLASRSMISECFRRTALACWNWIRINYTKSRTTYDKTFSSDLQWNQWNLKSCNFYRVADTILKLLDNFWKRKIPCWEAELKVWVKLTLELHFIIR